MANIRSVWDNKKSDVPKDHEMFTSQGGQSGTGILRPVKGPNKEAAQNDPNYLQNMMKNQQAQGIRAENKFEDKIYLYKNGYKIGNGPFNDATNNAEHKKFMDDLRAGVIPTALEAVLKQQFGNADAMGVELDQSKLNEEYVAPQPEKGKFAAFKGAGHSMVDDSKTQEMDQTIDSVPPKRIEFDDKQPNTRIQIILIGGKKEAIKVNQSTTVLQIYAHVKAISGHDGKFSLLAGFPPAPLTAPYLTVEAAKLGGGRITQKKL